MKDEKIRVLIVENSRELCEILEDLISSESDMEVAGIAHDGIQALFKIQEDTPDVILLDMVMPYLDGIEVLERLSSLTLVKRPKIIVLSAFETEKVLNKSSKLGIDYYMLKPFDNKVLLNRIRQVIGFKNPTKSYAVKEYICEAREEGILGIRYDSLRSRKKRPRFNLENKAIITLHELGVPSHFKGYAYLRDSIIVGANDVSILDCVTKRLYPVIAGKYGTTKIIVEAAIRYIILKTWQQGNKENLSKIFGYAAEVEGSKPPTNSSFISKVSGMLSVEMIENSTNVRSRTR